VALLVAGGVAYTAGVAFFAWERLPYNHTIWHLFVLAGSALHFSCVFGYVIP
jgi:hemolysin III